MKKILAVAVVLLMAVSAQASVIIPFNVYDGNTSGSTYVSGMQNIRGGVSDLGSGVSVNVIGGSGMANGALNTVHTYGIGERFPTGDQAFDRWTSFTVTSTSVIESVQIAQNWFENSMGEFTYLASATSPISGPNGQNTNMQGTFSNGNKTFTLTSTNAAHTAGGVITVVPEPATMSLLVLGGIATLLKRRNRR